MSNGDLPAGEQPPPDNGKSGHTWWHRLVEPPFLFTGIAVLVLAVIWDSAFNLSSREYAAADRSAKALAADSADTYEAQAVRALREIDNTLKLVRYNLRETAPPALLEALRSRGLLPPELRFTIAITDREGDVVASSPAAERDNVADTDYFQLARQDPESNEWRLHFSRRIEDNGQGFAGIVPVSVHAGYFVSGYEPSVLGEQGVLGLVGTDGIFRVRRTGDDISAGAFDVTAGSLVNLWGFGPADGSGTPPSPRDIDAAKALVSFGDLRIRRNPPALRKPHDAVFVDLSGIAKGDAADRISEYLGEGGIDRHLVEIGGELRAAGSNADNQPWSIAVEKPSYEARRSIHEVIRLHDGGVATSGDYRNFFEHDERRYSHIIDPRSGRPVEHDLVSATIVAPTAALADAYATAVLVSGPDEGMAMLRRRGLDGMLILRTDNGFEQLLTPGFRTLLEPRQ